MNPFRIHIVLVESLYDLNVGSVSRVMTNMGAERLILINPQVEMTYTAQQMAATGQGPLKNRTVYRNWDEFFKNEPESLRIAFTPKDGGLRQVRAWPDTLTWLKENSPWLNDSSLGVIDIHLIFGREDSGLSNEDLENTHYNCYLPIFGENLSLNLSHAVLYALALLRQSLGGVMKAPEGHVAPRKSKSDFPDELIQKFLTEMGLSSEDRNQSAFHTFKRLLLHNTPTSKEMGILHVIFQQALRKIQDYNQLRKSLSLPYIESEKKAKKSAEE
jgi:tRNA/rRNA methyltransferase